MTGWNMPPGCNPSDIPGNRPEDGKWEALIDGFWDSRDFSAQEREALNNCPQVYVDLIDKAIEYGVGMGIEDERQNEQERKYYEEMYKEGEKWKKQLGNEWV